MDENVIHISAQRYDVLIQTEAKVQSLMAYVNRTRCSVDRDMIGGILGFTVNEVKDGESRERNADGAIL